MALATARYATARELLLPLAIGASAVPIIAFAPLMNNWFGVINPLSKMMMVAVLVFFPIVVNVTRGLTQVEPAALELMRSYAASEGTILRVLRIPNALPYFFTALKVAATLSLIGAIVGEYFGGSSDVLGRVVVAERERAALRRDLGGDPARSRDRHRLLPGHRRHRTTRHPVARLDACHRTVAEERAPEGPGSGRAVWRSRSRQGINSRRRHEAIENVPGAGRGGQLPACGLYRPARRPRRPRRTDVRLQLQWAPQAQFAGYFAAAAEGYYEDEGLNVTFVPGGPDIIPQVAGSAADGPEFTISWVPKVLEARLGTPPSDLVNIAQIFQRSGTKSVSWKDSNITSPADFAGKKVGVWDFGNEFEVTAAARKARARGRHRLREGHPAFDMALLLSARRSTSPRR